MKHPARRTTSQSTWLRVGALIALTIIAYLPAFGADFIWDDPDYVINNPNLRTAGGLAKIWLAPRSLPQYYPLVHTTFWIEYQLWQLNPHGYHATNILLHAMGAVLLWRVLVKLEVPGAWLAAAIFAVHPLHVESVAWITERKNVLSGVFYFAAALAYLRFETSLARQSKWYIIALALFACALLSKTVTCSLPAAILLVIWWKRGRVTWADVLPLLPMFALGGAMAAYTAYLEVDHVGAGGAEWDYTPVQRLIIAGKAIWFYALKLVAPLNLSFVHAKWTVATWEIAYYALAIGVILALILLHRRIGRGPAVAALFFVGTLLPALGFFRIYPMRYTFAADHYQYLASVGLIVLLAAGVAKLAREPFVNALGLALLMPLVALTFIRARVFHDPLTLWADTVRKNPESWMVNLNLAQALGRAGRMDQAELRFRRAVDLAPQLAETHYNLGVHLAELGRIDEAMRKYDDALRLDPRFPGAYYSRGNVQLAQNDLEAAKSEYFKAIEHYPEYPQAHFNLALIAERQGDIAAAIAEYRKAVAGDPLYAKAHDALGRLLVKERRFDEALHHYREAVRIQPNFAEARLNLGALLARMGKLPEAQRQIAEAVRLDPALGKYANQALGK